MAGMSWITPISLFTNITLMRIVSGRIAALSVQVQQAVFLHIQIGDFKALAFQLAHDVQHRLVLGLTVIRCLPLLLCRNGQRP